MTLPRMEHVGIVVDDLASAIAFFTELGLELEDEVPVEGRWVDRIVALDGVKLDIAMLRTPDGTSRLELMKFHAPGATAADRRAVRAELQALLCARSGGHHRRTRPEAWLAADELLKGGEVSRLR